MISKKKPAVINSWFLNEFVKSYIIALKTKFIAEDT